MIKTMKKLSVFFIIIACFFAAFPVAASEPAGDDIPKIAVYVAGRTAAGNSERRALMTYILEALIKSGKYEAIERSERFLSQVDSEQQKQRSGDIDDAQISKLGRQSGVNFICVADLVEVKNTYQVSARIINVETAKVMALGAIDGRLSSVEDIREAAYSVVGKMLGEKLSAADKGAAAPKDGDCEVVITGPGDIFSSGQVTVSIDGEKAGTMRGDGTLKIFVSPGTYHLSAKWQGSDASHELKNPFKFTVKKGQKTMLKVDIVKMFGPMKVTSIKK